MHKTARPSLFRQPKIVYVEFSNRFSTKLRLWKWCHKFIRRHCILSHKLFILALWCTSIFPKRDKCNRQPAYLHSIIKHYNNRISCTVNIISMELHNTNCKQSNFEINTQLTNYASDNMYTTIYIYTSIKNNLSINIGCQKKKKWKTDRFGNALSVALNALLPKYLSAINAR